MIPRQRKALGEVLIEQGLVTRDQFDKALEEKQKGNESLRHVLIKLGFVNAEALNRFYE